MATDPNSLLAGSACVNNFGPGGFPLLELKLLGLWATQENASAKTDPATLLAGSQCYANYQAQAWLLKLGLLRNILSGLAPTLPTEPQFLMFTQSYFDYNNFGPGMWSLFDVGLLGQIVLQNNPAADIKPADLLAGSNCNNNYAEQSWLLKLGLLQHTSQAVNPSAATDPASLLALSACYNNYGPGMWPLFEVQLLNLIFNNGGVIPPPTDDYRITSDGSTRSTSTGDLRIVKP